MKKILFAVMLCLLTTQAYAKNPLQIVKSATSEVIITALQNNLEIRNISANRGNCATIISLRKGQTLQYGEKTVVWSVHDTSKIMHYGGDWSPEQIANIEMLLKVGLKQYCPILELVVDTNAGQWTFSWENQ